MCSVERLDTIERLLNQITEREKRYQVRTPLTAGAWTTIFVTHAESVLMTRQCRKLLAKDGEHLPLLYNALVHYVAAAFRAETLPLNEVDELLLVEE